PTVVAKGEYSAGFAVPSYMAFEEKLAGFDIKFVAPKNAFVTPEPMAILAGARNPKAARAFIEFLLTERGQRVFTERGLFPITPRYKARERPAPTRRWPSSSRAACAPTSTARSPTSTTRASPRSAPTRSRRGSARKSKRSGRSRKRRGRSRGPRSNEHLAARCLEGLRPRDRRRPGYARDRRRRALHTA